MAFIPGKARVMESSTTSGGGPYALAGAIDPSYNAFSSAMSVGDTTLISVIEPGVAFWTGIGTYSATNEITLTTIEESKGTFGAGTKQIFMGPLAGRQVAVDGAQSTLSQVQKLRHQANIGVGVHGADIASAGTIDLDSATGDVVDVTGTTTITAVTLADGREKTVRFTGILTLTNGSSLLLPSADDIVTAAGDFAVFRGYAAGVVRCVAYQPRARAGMRKLLGLSTGPDAAIEYVIDNGTQPIPTGLKGYLEVPFDCTITRASLLADVSGSIVVDIWKCSYANFAPGTHPVSSDKITASAPPTISGALKSQDSTLTGWTLSLSAGDILAFNVNSVTTIKRVTLSLKVLKS